MLFKDTCVACTVLIIQMYNVTGKCTCVNHNLTASLARTHWSRLYILYPCVLSQWAQCHLMKAGMIVQQVQQLKLAHASYPNCSPIWSCLVFAHITSCHHGKQELTHIDTLLKVWAKEIIDKIHLAICFCWRRCDILSKFMSVQQTSDTLL